MTARPRTWLDRIRVTACFEVARFVVLNRHAQLARPDQLRHPRRDLARSVVAVEHVQRQQRDLLHEPARNAQRRRHAGQVADRDEPSTRLDPADPLGELLAADGVDQQRGPADGRQLVRRIGIGQQQPLRPGGDALELIGSPDRTDDIGAGCERLLHDLRADGAGRAGHDDRFSGLEVGEVVEGDERGHRRLEERGGLIGRHRIGQGQYARSGCAHVLGPASGPLQSDSGAPDENGLADGEVIGFDDRAVGLDAGDVGQGPVGAQGPVRRGVVEPVHRGDLDAHQHLAGRSNRSFDLIPDRQAAPLMDLRRAHHAVPCSPSA